MRTIALFIFSILLLDTPGNAQIGDSRADMDVIFNDMSKAYNKGLKKDHLEIDGSPFYNDDWDLADIILSNNKTLSSVPLKLNLYSSEIYYLSEKKNEVILAPGLIRQLRFKSGGKQLFRSGYPPVDDHTKNTFYNVLEEGRIILLKSIEKTVSLGNDFDKRRSFVQREDYFLFKDNALSKFKNRRSIIDLLPDKKVEITSFIEKNNFNLRNEDHLAKIVAFCNSFIE
jgi:hypothetical protein